VFAPFDRLRMITCGATLVPRCCHPEPVEGRKQKIIERREPNYFTS